MEGLTLFVLKNDTPAFANVKRLLDSFSKVKGVANVVVVNMEDRRLDLIEVETDWWMYMFDNEYLDPAMIRVLSTYLESEVYDFFQAYQRIIVPEMVDGVEKARVKTYLSPRIFRAKVRVQSEHIYIPIDVDNLTVTSILDGWIVRD